MENIETQKDTLSNLFEEEKNNNVKLNKNKNKLNEILKNNKVQINDNETSINYLNRDIHNLKLKLEDAVNNY